MTYPRGLEDTSPWATGTPQASTNLNHTNQAVTAKDPEAAALWYAGRGIPVFPCKPGGKRPLTPSGHLDATTDRSRIIAWWNANPHANIGIPTGPRSGIISLDLDTYKPGAMTPADVAASLGPLPETATVRTGGGGLQFYFRPPEGETLKGIVEDVLGKGVCVKADGGYVIAPPSHTTGPYEWLERRPLAEAPGWLVEAARKPPSSRRREREIRTPTPILADREKIPEGRRNVTLTSKAGSLHDGTRTPERLAADLLVINEELCVPRLPEDEVEKIAASISKKPPAKASREVDEEVLRTLDGIEAAHLWGREWKGPGWKTPRSVMVVLLREARKYGRKTRDGVQVSIGVRALALAGGVSKAALTRSNGALDKLKNAGIIRSLRGSGTKSGAFVLVTPRAKLTHSSTFGFFPFSGLSLRAPLAAPRLRYSKPVYETVGGVREYVHHVLRLGKSAEAAVDVLERVAEWMSVVDLAAALGLARPRDLRRRVLPRLEGAAVVECSDDMVRLRLDWLAALNRKRERDGEIADDERDEKRYAEQSRNHRDRLQAWELWRVGMDPEEIASELGIGIEDVRHHLHIKRAAELPAEAPQSPNTVGEYLAAVSADGFIEDLERVEADRDHDGDRDHDADHAHAADHAQPTDVVITDATDPEQFRRLATMVREHIAEHRRKHPPAKLSSPERAARLLRRLRDEDPDLLAALSPDPRRLGREPWRRGWTGAVFPANTVRAALTLLEAEDAEREILSERVA